MNTYINHRDFLVFIETRFHKRGKIFLEEGLQDYSQNYKDYMSNDALFFFFLLYAPLAIALTEYINCIQLYLFVCLLVFTFIYIIILQKEHFSFVLDILGLNLKLQLSKYVILGAPSLSLLLPNHYHKLLHRS